jgi:hypothetical protein
MLDARPLLAFIAALALLLSACPAIDDDDDDSATTDDDDVADDDDSAPDDDDVADDDDSAPDDDDAADDDDSAPATALVWGYHPDPLLAFPVWIAWQDGDGAWTELTVEADGVFESEVADPEGRYGVVAVCQGQGVNLQSIVGTLAEMDHVFTVCGMQPDPALVNVPITGTVGGLVSGDNADVKIGGAAGDHAWPSFDYPDYSLQVAPAALDAVASLLPTGGSAPTKMILERGLDTTTGAFPVDFSAAGVDTASRTLTLTGEGAEDAYTMADYWTTGGLFAPTGFGSGATLDFSELPAAEREDGDLNYIEITVGDYMEDDGVVVNGAFLPGSDIEIALPTNDCTALVELSDARDLGFSVSWNVDAAAVAYVARIYGYDNMTMTQKIWSLSLTPNRVGTAPAWSTPDWSAVSGWDALWGITADNYPEWDAGTIRVTSDSRDITGDMLGWLIMLYHFRYINSASSGLYATLFAWQVVMYIIFTGGML